MRCIPMIGSKQSNGNLAMTRAAFGGSVRTVSLAVFTAGVTVFSGLLRSLCWQHPEITVKSSTSNTLDLAPLRCASVLITREVVDSPSSTHESPMILMVPASVVGGARLCTLC